MKERASQAERTIGREGRGTNMDNVSTSHVVHDAADTGKHEARKGEGASRGMGGGCSEICNLKEEFLKRLQEDASKEKGLRIFLYPIMSLTSSATQC